MAAQVLICGKDPTLLSIRALVLKHIGMDPVCRLIDAADEPDLIAARLAVLCSSIGYKDQEKVAAAIKRRWPETSVLMIRSGADGMHQEPSGAYVCGIHPEEIVSTCQKVLRSRA